MSTLIINVMFKKWFLQFNSRVSYSCFFFIILDFSFNSNIHQFNVLFLAISIVHHLNIVSVNSMYPIECCLTLIIIIIIIVVKFSPLALHQRRSVVPILPGPSLQWQIASAVLLLMTVAHKVILIPIRHR